MFNCWIVIIVTFVSTIFLVKNTSAEAVQPYNALEANFALSIEPSRRIKDRSFGHPIITFIPRNSILFIKNRYQYNEISNKKYVKAITQDGININVFDSVVSTKINDQVSSLSPKYRISAFDVESLNTKCGQDNSE